MERIGIMNRFLTPTHRSACRALCLICVTIFITSRLTLWMDATKRISPLLTIIMVLVVIFFLMQLWKKYSSDVSITIFRLILQTIQFCSHLRTGQNNDGVRYTMIRIQAFKQFMRIVLLFFMAQICLILPIELGALWLHMLLTCKFVMDIISLVVIYFNQQDQRDANGNSYPVDETLFSKVIHWAIVIFKICYASFVLYFTLCHLSSSFVIVTVTYYLITIEDLHATLTVLMQYFNLDYLEGMEKFYVKGFCGVLQIIFALVFMVWSLVKQKQVIVFLALYTNIYEGLKDFIKQTLSVALTEWTNLSQFEKATKAEIAQYDDVCAVCLAPMSLARKTPCNHIFHGRCLRECLKEKPVCPMCNTSLVKS